MPGRVRSFGSSKPSRASKRAAAAQYLVMARDPDTDTLSRMFGIPAHEAMAMITQEHARRANLARALGE